METVQQVFLDFFDVTQPVGVFTAFLADPSGAKQLDVINNQFAFGQITFPVNPMDQDQYSTFLTVNINSVLKFSVILHYVFVAASGQCQPLYLAPQLPPTTDLFYTVYVNSGDRLTFDFASA